LSCDEVTTIDNGWWICVHAYVIDCWTRVPIFVCFDRIVDRSCSNNLIQVIMNVLLKCGSWTRRNFLKNYCVLEQVRWMYFRVGKQKSQNKDSWSPCFMGVQIMVGSPIFWEFDLHC
jgi:hypothetical protein